MKERFVVRLDDAALRALLDGLFEHENAVRIIGDVNAELALRVVPGLPYTIATLASHMLFWQQRRIRAVRGEELDYPEDFVLGETDFPAVDAADWDNLRTKLLASYEELLAIAAEPGKLAAMIFENRSAGFVATSHACHNSYHLGQIVLLRRLLGSWPPAAAQVP